jgi:hypothetical protein
VVTIRTTTAFEAANIFARTSGYVEKRYVDKYADRKRKAADEDRHPTKDHLLALRKQVVTPIEHRVQRLLPR